MGYDIDLSQISLDEYQEILQTEHLVPSRMVLREDIERKFKLLKEENLENVAQIREAVKTKKKLAAFSEASGIDQEYLTLLLREINSVLRKPNKIADFPGVSIKTVEALEKMSIKHTLHLFEHVLTPESRADLAAKTGIPLDEIQTLTKLTDLSRVRWVNHTFAHVLLALGFESAKMLAEADDNDLYQRLNKINQDNKYFKGKLGLIDITRCIAAARDVTPEITF